MTDKSEVWAPRTFSSEARGAGGGTSFEAYFLRDLYRQGKINDELIKQLFAQEQIDAPVDEVIKVIADTSGKSIPRGLLQYIVDLATVMPGNN